MARVRSSLAERHPERANHFAVNTQIGCRFHQGNEIDGTGLLPPNGDVPHPPTSPNVAVQSSAVHPTAELFLSSKGKNPPSYLMDSAEAAISAASTFELAAGTSDCWRHYDPCGFICMESLTPIGAV